MSVFFVGPLSEPAHLRKLLGLLKYKSADVLVAIDGGASILLKSGFLPQMTLGDWDSLKEFEPRQWKQLLRRLPHFGFSKDKDESDLRLSIDWVAKNLRNKIKSSWYFLGVTGGREDHHLGSLLELSHASQIHGSRLESIQAWDPAWHYSFLSTQLNTWSFSGALKNQTLSVFPISNRVRGVTLQGVKYTLKNEDLLSASHGLSNLITGTRVKVSLKSGRLVMCRKWKELK